MRLLINRLQSLIFCPFFFTLLYATFFSSNVNASQWWVRDGGGTITQCTGQTNAVYPGSGINQNCAVNDIGFIVGVTGYYTTQPQRMVGGDTIFIDGDSDINPGQQAQYLDGYGMPSAQQNGGYVCYSGATYSCYFSNLPAGTSANPTTVIGTGSHKPQFYVQTSTYYGFDAENNYITLQNLEFASIQTCAIANPVNLCGAFDGMRLAGSNLVLTDIYIHGFSRYGIFGKTIGNMTATRLWVIGNGLSGFQPGSDGNENLTGTINLYQPIIEWNGCEEKYPMAAGIENPSNYINCNGQGTGGNGDGLPFGATGNQTVGNWNIIGPGSISFNTQDGLDLLHGSATSGTTQIDKMRFEGNGGQQIKTSTLNLTVTNSVIIGDCGWWYGAAQSVSGGMGWGDSCRASGATTRFEISNNGTYNWLNNTLIANGIAFESQDPGVGCNGSTVMNIKNNIIYGGYAWIDDTSFNSAGGNSLSTYYYADGNDGNGTGTCGQIGNGSGGLVNPTEDYNIVTGTKNNNAGCGGAHDKCGTSGSSIFSSVIPVGTAGGAANTYYQGTSGTLLMSLSSSSVAINAGVSGLSYWNTSNDYYNETQTSPPTIGALINQSCAAQNYGCFFNSDCCGGQCTNNVCGTGGGSLPGGVNDQITGIITGNF